MSRRTVEILDTEVPPSESRTVVLGPFTNPVTALEALTQFRLQCGNLLGVTFYRTGDSTVADNTVPSSGSRMMSPEGAQEIRGDNRARRTIFPEGTVIGGGFPYVAVYAKNYDPLDEHSLNGELLVEDAPK